MPTVTTQRAAGRLVRPLWHLLLAGLIGLLVLAPVLAMPAAAPSQPASGAAAEVAQASALPTATPGLPLAVLPAPKSPEPASSALAVLPLVSYETPLDELAPPQPMLYPRPVPSAEPEPSVAPAPKPKPKPHSQAKPAPSPESAPKPKPKPEPTPTPKPAPMPSEPTYQGTSKLWYPALGIKASWKWYGCEYGGDPAGLGTGVYRWGCAPKRNVYLMSHAWSTFKAIKKAYHSGAMKVGQKVWYADRKGNVTQWKVKWIKRVKLAYFNDTFWEWAANDSSTPIMTFQTCDGKYDQYRIIVRLVPAG